MRKVLAASAVCCVLLGVAGKAAAGDCRASGTGRTMECENGDVKIEADIQDCASGFLSMDIVVRIGNETFELNPSCNFSFDETIRTRKGRTYEIEAGMCSNFSPKNRFEIEGPDSRISMPIPCRPKE